MNAWEELNAFLVTGETIEAIVFGQYGWNGYGEPQPPAVPAEKQGVILTPAEAEPLMKSWKFYGGYGSPNCYAVYVWTSARVIWVTQYDGSTSLSSAPRNPTQCIPVMPGG